MDALAPPAEEARPHPAWRWLPAALAALTVALHVGFAGRYGYTIDEYYLLACAARPDWGYVDHPPVAVWILGLVRALFGPSVQALRAYSALAGAGTVLVTASLAGALGGGARARGMAALAVFACAGMQAHFDMATMNPLDLLLVALSARVAVAALASQRGHEWLAYGAVVGVGLMTKLSMAVVGAGMAAGLLATRARRHLKTPWPWLGALLAAALFSPFVLWQVENGWVTLAWMRWVTERFNHHFPPGELVLQLVVTLNPVTLPIWAAGLYRLTREDGPDGTRALGVATWTFLLIFAVRKIKIYYLFPVFPLAFAAGAVQLEAWTARASLRRLLAGYAAVLLGSCVVVLPHVIPILPIEAFLLLHRGLGVGKRIQHLPEYRIPGQFRFRFGWDVVVDHLAAALDALPPDQRAQAAILTETYFEASAVDFLGPDRGLPPAIGGGNQYWLWGPGDATGEVVLVVGYSRPLLEACFGSVESAGVIPGTATPHWHHDRPLWICRRPRASLEELWPRFWVYGGTPPARRGSGGRPADR